MSLAHPSVATFSPLSPGMNRAIRRQRLARHCRHLGATADQIRDCRDTGDFWALRCQLLDELMAAPDPDAA